MACRKRILDTYGIGIRIPAAPVLIQTPDYIRRFLTPIRVRSVFNINSTRFIPKETTVICPSFRVQIFSGHPSIRKLTDTLLNTPISVGAGSGRFIYSIQSEKVILILANITCPPSTLICRNSNHNQRIHSIGILTVCKIISCVSQFGGTACLTSDQVIQLRPGIRCPAAKRQILVIIIIRVPCIHRSGTCLILIILNHRIIISIKIMSVITVVLYSRL